MYQTLSNIYELARDTWLYHNRIRNGMYVAIVMVMAVRSLMQHTCNGSWWNCAVNAIEFSLQIYQSIQWIVCVIAGILAAVIVLCLRMYRKNRSTEIKLRSVSVESV